MHHQMPPFVSKTTKSAGSISQAMHCSPCLADPHAPRIHIRATLSYVSTAPPYSHQAPKISTLVSTRPAGPAPQIPTNPVKQTSRTCVTIQQTKRRPSPANATDLRSGVYRHLLHVRPWSYTFTGMRTAKRIPLHARSLTRTPSQACAYLHGHGASQFDETSVRRNKSPTNPVKQTP